MSPPQDLPVLIPPIPAGSHPHSCSSVTVGFPVSVTAHTRPCPGKIIGYLDLEMTILEPNIKEKQGSFFTSKEVVFLDKILHTGDH